MKKQTMLLAALLGIISLVSLTSCETIAVAGYVANNAHMHDNPPGVFISLPFVPVECGCQLIAHDRVGLFRSAKHPVTVDPHRAAAMYGRNPSLTESRKHAH